MNLDLKKYLNFWTVLLAGLLLTGFYLSVLYPWMNRWGVTDEELATPLPGDQAEPGKVTTSTRGVTIHAPAAEVWQWVVQLGQGQAGFYSHDWLENLFLSDIHNADRLHPEWGSHRAGEPVYGAGGALYGRSSYWPTLAYQEGQMLYLWGPIVVLPVDAHTSRLLVRTIAAPSSGAAHLVSQLTYDWMHFVMERGLLLGIKARVEGTLGSGRPLEILASCGWIAAALAVAAALFIRRRGWFWGLLPLAYAVVILVFTSDPWSALAGFLWWGIIAAGFLLFGRRFWPGLLLTIPLVIYIFVLAPQPFLAFGLLFLLLVLGLLGARLLAPPRSLFPV